MAPILLILGLMLFVSDSRVAAQTASTPQKGDNKQWLSHQMFQPLPQDPERSKLSADAIEEIKRLYIEAEKERQSRNQAKPNQRRP